MLTPSSSQQYAVIPAVNEDISNIVSVKNNDESNKNSMSFASILDNSRAANKAVNRAKTSSADMLKRQQDKSLHEEEYQTNASEEAASNDKANESSHSDEAGNSKPVDEKKSKDDSNSELKTPENPSKAVPVTAAAALLTIIPTANSLPVTNLQKPIDSVPAPVNPVNGSIAAQAGTVVTPQAGPPRTNGQLTTDVRPVISNKLAVPELPMDPHAAANAAVSGVGQKTQTNSSNISAAANSVPGIPSALVKADTAPAIAVTTDAKSSASSSQSTRIAAEAPQSNNGTANQPAVTAANPSEQTTVPDENALEASAAAAQKASANQLTGIERMLTVGKIESDASSQSKDANIQLAANASPAAGVSNSKASSPHTSETPLHSSPGIQPQTNSIAAAPESPVQDQFVPVTTSSTSISIISKNILVSLGAESTIKADIASPEVNRSSGPVISAEASRIGVSTAVRAETQTSSDSKGQSDHPQNSSENISAGIGPAGSTKSGIDAESAVQSSAPSTPGQQLERARIVDQVTRHLETMKLANGKGELTLQLQPAHLGSIRVTLSKSAAGVTAHILTQSSQVQQAMQGAQEHLRIALESRGITLDKFQISLNQNALQNGQSSFQSAYNTRQESAGQQSQIKSHVFGSAQELNMDAVDNSIAVVSNNTTSRLDYRA